MGCASSKPLKNQARSEGWTTPPSKSKHRAKTLKSDSAFDEQHRHLVALTSSSYGLLRVESPKPAAEVQKKRSTSGGDSLNDMYDKLTKLESTASAPRPWNEVSGLLEILKPGLEKSTSSPAQGWPVGPTDRANLETPETIDVRAMMRDLDEDTPRGPSPSKLVSPLATARSQLVSTNGFVSRQGKRFDKTVSFHTVAELDARLGRPTHVAVEKFTKGPLQEVVKNCTMLGHHKKSEQDGFEKENAKPPGTANVHLGETEGVPSRTGTAPRCPFAPPPINIQGNVSLHQLPSMAEKESDVNKRDTDETRISSNNTNTRSSQGTSPSAGTNHSGRSRKLKLTLNLEHKNSLSRGASLRWIASTPVDSFSKQALLNHPDGPNSPLFDPDLLESYEKALENFSANDWNAMLSNDERQLNIEEDNRNATLIETNQPTNMQRKLYDPFETFEEKCPPGGDKTVVLYTTTLRGIRKTFEDCNNVRDILQSFALSIDERDVSMHLKFRNELRELMGRVLSVPRMFIKGRYIGSVEEVVKLHENGHLMELVEGLPKEMNGGNCDGCGGVRFVPCLECSGSCKVVNESNAVVRCPDCNENGLIQCPICS